MSRANSILVAVVVLFMLFVLIVGIVTNLHEKQVRANAEHDAYVNALQERDLLDQQGPPIPPVILDAFRADVRAAVSAHPGQHGKAAGKPGADVSAALVAARAKALRSVSNVVDDPTPYLEQWKGELAKEEQKALDAVAGEGVKGGSTR